MRKIGFDIEFNDSDIKKLLKQSYGNLTGNNIKESYFTSEQEIQNVDEKANAILNTIPIVINNPETLNNEDKEIFEIYKNKKDGWRRKVTDWALQKLPQKTETSFGNIEYRTSKIRGALSHGFGDLKMLSLPHLDTMFKNGVLFDSHKEDGFTYYNVAHRLQYKGEDYIVRLVAREDRHGNLFYDHEFTDIKKIGAPATGREEANKSVTSPHQLFAKIAEKYVSSEQNTEKNNEKVTNAYESDNNDTRFSVTPEEDADDSQQGCKSPPYSKTCIIWQDNIIHYYSNILW